jgi:hypothetical protein
VQPCQVCGEMRVDAAGYCVRCRNYRGPVAAGDAMAAAGYPPATPNPGYPTSPPPGPGYPTSPPPGPGYPTSPPPGPGYPPVPGYPTSSTQGPGYPTSSPPGGYPSAPAGAGYPGAPVTAPPLTPTGYLGPPATPSPARQRSPFLIPLIAACAAVLVVVIGIVIVVLSKTGQPSNVAGGAASTPPHPPSSPPQSPLIDPCLIGVWSTTSNSQQFTIKGVGTMTLLLKTPYSETVTVNPDGTATQGYNHTKMEGALGGHRYGIDVIGVAHTTLRTANNTISFQTPTVTGTLSITVDKTPLTTVPLTISSDPVTYVCEGNTLTEHADGFDSTLTRQG